MAEPGQRDRSRLSGPETLMWRMEADPVLRSSFALICLLDAPPDQARLRRRLERVVEGAPRLRQRIEAPLAPVLGPEWVEDSAFDLDYHLRRVALPHPGTKRQLFDLATLWANDPFDPVRPLWEMLVVEGMRRGRGALLARMHHAVTDGMGGLALASSFLDHERNPAVAGGDDHAPLTGNSGERNGRPSGAERVLGEVLGRAQSLTGAVEAVAGNVGAVAGSAAAMATQPALLARGVQTMAETLRSLARYSLVVDRARSSLWSGRHSSARRFETLNLPLDPVRRRARALGGTVNDLFVTALAGGAAAYHRALGADVDELRISMPVNIRRGSHQDGNAFTPARVLVPAGIVDPVERFGAVHDRLAVVKADPALALTDTVASAFTGLPAPLLVRLVRQQVETVDFAASNVPGVASKVYLAGAKLRSTHPMGPTVGTAFNATAMSYRGRLFVGLNMDTAAVADPTLLVDSMRSGFEELIGSGE
jgi:diacylglycerol O-acyltransferase